MADVIDKIVSYGFKPVGELQGRCAQRGILAGRYGGLCRVEGETETERFACPIPFMDGLTGIDKAGKERFVEVRWFEGMKIYWDGSLRVTQRLRLWRVSFRLVDLPFEWSHLQYNLSRLITRYANETGLSRASLGRELDAGYPEYMEMSNIAVPTLKPVVEYVQKTWRDISVDPVPSRETIAATLEGLNMRPRTRGPNNARG